MTRRIAGLAMLALVAASCGGAKDATDAAQLVPANAKAFVRLRGRVPPPAAFPYAPREYATLKLPRLAPPVDIAFLPQGWVAFRRVKVKGARRIRGFTVTAQTKAALDAVRHVRIPLADAPRFRIGDAPLSAYFRGGRTLDVTDTTATVQWHARAEPMMGGIDVPKDAVAAVGLASGRPPAATLPTIRTISASLGVDVLSFLRFVDGPAYAYLEPSDLVPRVTVVATPRRPARALRDVARTFRRIGTETAAGTVDLGPLAVTYALEEGRIIVSTGGGRGPTEPIDGLPERVTGFAYAHGAAPTIAALAPALALSRPRLGADFLLYETQDGSLRSRVVRLDR